MSLSIYLAQKREKIMRMSHQEALSELVRINRIDNKTQQIKKLSNNGLLEKR